MLGSAAMDHEQRLEQHDRMIADLDRAMAEWRERFEREMAESRQKHNRDMAEIREAQKQLVTDVGQMFRRAIKLAVQEARAERRKRRELDEKITQLAAAQLLAEEQTKDLKTTLKAFIESLHRGTERNKLRHASG
jgi:hypothetical protein